MQNRRIFLKSIAPLAAALSLPAKAEGSQEDDCRFYADRLEEAMKAKHGGDWVIALNPDGGSIFGRRIT
jgi:hypothetical protein